MKILLYIGFPDIGYILNRPGLKRRSIKTRFNALEKINNALANPF